MERMTLLGGGGLDRAISRLETSLANVSLSMFARDLNIARILQRYDELKSYRNAGIVDELFLRPDGGVTGEVIPIHGFPDGEILDLELPSTFPRIDFPAADEYRANRRNQSSYVRLWEHHGDRGDRPTIVAIHGWTMGDQRLNSLAFMPGLFFSLGCNVALVELPFHGRRIDSASAPSSFSFPSLDPIFTCLSMAHAIYDLRLLAHVLEDRQHRNVSCVAMSLGSYVGQLWCSLDALRQAVFIVPLVSMSQVFWDLTHQTRTDTTIPGLERLTPEISAELFRDHDLIGRGGSPTTQGHDILVIGGHEDRVIPRSQIELLQSYWPDAEIMWLEGGHGAHLGRGKAFDRMREFLLAQHLSKTGDLPRTKM